MTSSLPSSWLQALRVYTHPRVLGMLTLGFSAGLPLLLIMGTLSFWLRRPQGEVHVDRFVWKLEGTGLRAFEDPRTQKCVSVCMNSLDVAAESRFCTRALVPTPMVTVATVTPLPGPHRRGSLPAI